MAVLAASVLSACDGSESPISIAEVFELAGTYRGTEFVEADFCLMRAIGSREAEIIIEQTGEEIRLESDLLEATGTVHEDGSLLLSGDVYGNLGFAEVTISGFFRELGERLLVKAWIDGVDGHVVCFARISYELARVL